MTSKTHHLVAPTTRAAVLAIVVERIAAGQRLPTTKMIAAHVGRSVRVAQDALAQLHDAGEITLMSDGDRYRAEIPQDREAA